jgi:hypothetical protein
MKKLIFITLALVLFNLTVNAQSGTVAYYPFNGNANDYSGNSNNGFVYGATPTTDRFGNSNSAYSFDGNDYIEIPSSTSLNPVNQLSIAIWIKATNLPNTYTPILHKGGPYQSGFTNREYIMFIEKNGTSNCNIYAESTGNIGRGYTNVNNVSINNTWVFYVATFDRINHYLKLYLNGVMEAQATDNNSSFINNNNPLKIGAWDETNSTYAPFYIGCLDDLRIFNKVLTEQEVLDLYNETAGIADAEVSNIVFYPNPVNNILNIKGLTDNSTISIYDYCGKIVLSNQIKDNKIDVSSLSNGIYSIVIIDKKGVKTGAFLKQ